MTTLISRGRVVRVSVALAALLLAGWGRAQEEGKTGQLHEAVKAGDVERISALLNEKADVNGVDRKTGNTPLLTAIGAGNKEVVELLLDRGADVSKRAGEGATGSTPLQAAVLGHRGSIAELLLKKGADPNARLPKESTGSVSLLPALLSQELPPQDRLAGLLLAHGLEVNYVDENSHVTPLQAAIASRDVKVVVLLLAAKADIDMNVNMYRPSPVTNVSLAIEWAGQGEALQALANAGGKVTAVEAAALADPALLASMLQTSPSAVKARDSAGKTPLHMAAYGGRRECVRLLLSKGADPNARDCGDVTPLHCVFEGYLWMAHVGYRSVFDRVDEKPFLDVLRALLDAGADPNVFCRWGKGHTVFSSQGSSPLHSAIGTGFMSAIQLLVDKKSDLNLKDAGGNTPLFAATGGRIGTGSRMDRIGLMKYLVEKGGDPAVVNNAGENLLHWAMRTRNEAMVDYLLGKGVNPFLKAGNGLTPWDLAVNAACQDMATAMLKKHGFQVPEVELNDAKRMARMNEWQNAYGRVGEMRDAFEKDPKLAGVCSSYGDNLIHYAARFGGSRDGWSEFIHALVGAGCDINAQNKGAMTPLWYAALGDAASVAVLLENGAKPDVADRIGDSPLHYAAGGWRPDSVTALVAAGADVSLVNSKGWTPLHSAAYNVWPTYDASKRFAPVLRLLVGKGADINARDRTGKTPLGIAKERGNEKARDVLLANGAKE